MSYCRVVASAVIAAVGLLLVPQIAEAQASPRCRSEAHRQFDFWIGTWTVVSPNGDSIGHSTISSLMDGCVIQEKWDAGAVRGTSLSIFDRPNDRWTQTWVDNRGVHLRLEGGYNGTAMAMTGTRLGGDGVRRHFRVTWTPMEDCRVRQLQQVSEDGGTTWNVGFDAVYRPEGGKCPDSEGGS